MHVAGIVQVWELVCGRFEGVLPLTRATSTSVAVLQGYQDAVGY